MTMLDYIIPILIIAAIIITMLALAGANGHDEDEEN